MKRLTLFFIAAFALLLLPFSAYAGEAEFSEEDYKEQLGAYDFSFFEDTLDGDTYSFLEELGFLDFDVDSLTELSLERVTSLLKDVVSRRIKNPLEGMSAILVYVLLSALFQSLKSESSDMGSLYSTVSALAVALVLIAKVSPSVALGASSVKIASDFVFAFIPVFAAIVAASGGVTAAFSTNAMLLSLSQALSLLSSNIFIPVINCFLGVGICSGLRAELELQKLIAGLRRFISSSVSFIAGVYVTVLSIKTTVAARADALGIRSLRFVLNSAVPVVGGALSEGLLSIQSYSSLIKSSVGVVGICAVALIFLPALVEAVLWRFVLYIGLVVCDVFGDKSVSLVLEAFKDTMLLINVVLIVSMLSVVVSLGILVAAGGN